MLKKQVITRQMTWIAILELALLFGCSVKGQFHCSNFPVGLTNPNIVPDDKMQASSELTSQTEARYGRIDGTRGDRAWCPSLVNGLRGEWLQVELYTDYSICGITVQGGFIGHVDQFELSFSTEGDDGGDSSFTTLNKRFVRPSHYGQEEAVFYDVTPQQTARYIRFNPVVQNAGICVRLEYYGFPAPRITCLPDFMTAEFNLQNYPDLRGQEMHLSSDQSCVAETRNSSYVRFQIPLEGCGTQKFTRDDDLLYVNEVIQRVNSSIEPISRRLDMSFIVRCFYARDDRIGGVDFEVPTNGTTDSSTTDSGSGRLQPWGGRVSTHMFWWIISLGLAAAVMYLPWLAE